MEAGSRKKKIITVTILGTIVNVILLILKFAAGFIGRSSAMIADAVHSLSDFVTDLVVLLFINISSKPVDDSHRYGHGKFETLATTIIGAVLFFVGLGLLWQGSSKIYGFYFWEEELSSPGYIALIAAIISIILKEIVYRITVKVAKECDSQALIANGWHHRSDAFSSIGTAMGIGGAIFLGDNWRVLDPIAAVIVSFFIIKVAVQLVVPALNDLLERSLPTEVENDIIQVITNTPGIYDPHNLRTRRIGNNYAIEAHVRMEKDMTVYCAHEITLQVEKQLRERFGPGTHISLHVEPIKD